MSGEPSVPGAWHVSDLNKLRRFLCMGTEGGTYFSCGGKELSKGNAQCIFNLIEAGRGDEVVKEIVSFSLNGKAARPEAVAFALATCARLSSHLKIKQAAYKALSQVCQSPTQLFRFVEYAQMLSGNTTGWGRAQRKAINDWYNNKDPKDLALAVTQYVSRNGWTHTDLLRLAHVKPKKDSTSLVLKYVVKGYAAAKEQFPADGASDDLKTLLSYLEAVDTVKHSKDEQQAARLIEQFKLVREHVPTGLHNSPEVWRALLHHIPLEVLLRSVARLTALGLFLEPPASNSHAHDIIDQLSSEQSIQASKIHPFVILMTLKMYEQGKGHKGKVKWVPNRSVIDALTAAFHTAFKNVEPTNKRLLLAVDVSNSMTYGEVNGSPAVKPLVAAACMAMAAARTEDHYELVAFSSQIFPVTINATMTLTEVCSALAEGNVSTATPIVRMGSTDVAAPITWAMEEKKKMDVFLVFTDSETWSENVKPAEALRRYRTEMGISDAKLVVCALTSSGFTLADQTDAGMLDIVGFDASGPSIISQFIRGEL